MNYLFISLLFSLILLVSCSENSTKESDQVKADLSTSVDAYFKSVSGFSGNVLIAQNGKLLFSKSYGYADREFNILNEPGTKFKIGSITKPFTAMAVLKLVEENKLSLSDSVGRFLKEVPSTWQPLTVHQLLSHTAGLIHTWDVLEDSTLMFQKSDLRNTLSWYFDKPLLFEPGTSFSYSGVGYFILAVIIESVTNTSYDRYLEKTIFNPLNMENTGASDPETIIPKLARGYVTDSSTVLNAPDFYVPLLTGGGHLYSTTEDLMKWDRALAEFSILSKEMTAKMYAPVGEDYGYGWDIVKNDTLNMVFHTGFIPGYLSRMDRYLDHDVTLIILTNYQSEWSPVDSWDITNIIFEGLHLKNN